MSKNVKGTSLIPWKTIFWCLALIVLFAYLVIILSAMLKRFLTYSVSIGLDTSYLLWTNTFPAISICLSKNRPNADFIEKANVSSQNNYAKAIYEYMFISPNNLFIYDKPCKGLNSTCGVDIDQMRNKLLPESCKIFMKDVRFNGKLYMNCEEIFKFRKHEMGNCFLANNIMEFKRTETIFPLSFDRSTEKKKLQIFLKDGAYWKYQLYIHSQENEPYLDYITRGSASIPMRYSYNIEEIQNSYDVATEDAFHRGCKYPYENLNGVPSYYSFSKCMTELKTTLELEICNCTVHTSSKMYSKNYCDIEGIACLSSADVLSRAKYSINTRDTCLPSCTEQQIHLVGYTEVINISRKGCIYTEIEVINEPYVLYKRDVIQNYLDLIVAIGGVFGLFFGASVLNFLEIILLEKKLLKFN